MQPGRWFVPAKMALQEKRTARPSHRIAILFKVSETPSEERDVWGFKLGGVSSYEKPITTAGWRRVFPRAAARQMEAGPTGPRGRRFPGPHPAVDLSSRP